MKCRRTGPSHDIGDFQHKPFRKLSGVSKNTLTLRNDDARLISFLPGCGVAKKNKSIGLLRNFFFFADIVPSVTA